MHRRSGDLSRGLSRCVRRHWVFRRLGRFLFSCLGRSLDSNRGGPDSQLALTDNRVDASDVTLDSANASVTLELAGRGLEAKVEQFFLGLLQLFDESFVFVSVEIERGELLGSDRHYESPSSRLMMRAFNGSL